MVDENPVKALIASLAAMGDDERPETMFDDIGNAYDTHETVREEMLEAAHVEVAKLAATNEALQKQVIDLTKHNYELLRATGTNDAAADTTSTETDNDDDSSAIDGLFDDEETE